MGTHLALARNSLLEHLTRREGGKTGRKTEGKQKGAPPDHRPRQREARPAEGAAGGARARTDLASGKSTLAHMLASRDFGEGRSHNKVETPVPTDPEGSGAEPVICPSVLDYPIRPAK